MKNDKLKKYKNRKHGLIKKWTLKKIGVNLQVKEFYFQF